jgi:lipid II:glycine glycyltransferase (peptidoglycan interpeptide bridge formation enzyme)
LYWEIIKTSLKREIKIMDLGQVDINCDSGSHAEGLLKFKEKWLGKIYQRAYFTYEFGRPLDKKARNSRYNMIRLFWKKLPLFVVKIIGPRICAQLGI